MLSLSLSISINLTVDPNFIVLPDNLSISITSERAILSSNSWILLSIKLCLSRADLYSAFSDRSPNSLAAAIALVISGLSFVLSSSNFAVISLKPFSAQVSPAPWSAIVFPY